jgi:hypothetical protein
MDVFKYLYDRYFFLPRVARNEAGSEVGYYYLFFILYYYAIHYHRIIWRFVSSRDDK